MTEPTPDLHVCDAAITSAFSVLGKRWNGMLLRVLGFGTGSFAELRRAVPGISDTMLADRLAELAGAGLVDRIVRRNISMGKGMGLMAMVDAVRALAKKAAASQPA